MTVTDVTLAYHESPFLDVATEDSGGADESPLLELEDEEDAAGSGR